MKKFRFFVVLLGLFALLGFSKTINAQETVNVSITVMKDGTQVGDVVSTTGTLGGTITPVGLPAVADGTFMFWTVNGVVRTDLPENPTIRVTSKMVLVAHYASTGKYSVAYLDANTKLLHVDYVAGAEDLTPPSTNPERQGTSFDGWVSIADYTAVGNMTPANPGAKAYFVAKYTVTAVDTYTVTVDGTPLEGTYKLNDTATAVSTDPNFSYWKDETGAVLSYESSYTFSVLNANVTLTSVKEGAVDKPLVSIRRFVGYETGKNAFIGHYELDLTKYELVEVGFVHHDNPTRHVTKNVNDETKEFMVVAPDTLLDSSYKMRAYMTYKKIGSNELTTIYSINGIVKINDTNGFKALATATAEELSKTYILTQNIEFPTEGAGRWFTVPIGNATTPFTGTFDGQGFTIAGFQGGDHTVENFGIFGVIGKTGVVKNLGLVGRSEHTVNLGVTNDFYWGKNSAIVASVNKGLIENLYVQVRLMSPTTLVSGLVSDNQGTVRYVVSRSRAFKEDPYEPYAAFALTNTGTVSNVFVDADYTEATTFLPGHPELNSNLLVAAFYQAATYASFDPTIWLIQEDEIPALKPQITP